MLFNSQFFKLKASALLILATSFVGNDVIAQHKEFNSVPDMRNQFANLAHYPEALGVNLTLGPEPTVCKHFQSVTRYEHEGTSYLILTRSGNIPTIDTPIIDIIPDELPCLDIGDDPGNLYIVPMESSDGDGERLRSNRLARTSPPSLGNSLPDNTAPDAADMTAIVIDFDGTDGWPDAGHPGGMEIIDDVLMIGTSHNYDDPSQPGMIMFIDLSDPLAPRLIRNLTFGFGTGFVAVAPLPNGNYLMMLQRESSKLFDVLESVGGDLKDPALRWQIRDQWYYADRDDVAAMGGDHWYTGSDGPQTMNLVREGGLDGDLFLIGSRNTFPPDPTNGANLGEDWVDLYRIVLEDWDNLTPNVSQLRIEWIDSILLNTIPTNGGDEQLAHLRAAGGIYTSPSGELIFYGCEHADFGPNNSLNCAEWRDQDIVTPDSPSYDPSASTGDVVTILEGFSDTITVQPQAAATKPWVLLYNDTDPDPSKRALVIDYLDWDLDDYDDFSQLGLAVVTMADPTCDPRTYCPPTTQLVRWDDKVSSMRAFAPPGCTITFYDSPNLDSNEGSFQIFGDGSVQEIPDLALEGWDNRISSMEFSDSCESYYNAELDVSWDLNNDGHYYDASGEEVTFNAGGLEGPGEYEALFQVTNRIDNRSGYGHVKVQVVNVPPVASIDNVLNVEYVDTGRYEYIAITHLPVLFDASFTDWGFQDTQSAQLTWGEGPTIPSAGYPFDAFEHAYGGATGNVEASHIYRQTGIFPVDLIVQDDDGGSDSISRRIRVIESHEALEETINAVNGLMTPSAPMNLNEMINNAVNAIDNMVSYLYADQLEGAISSANSTLALIDKAELAAATDLSTDKSLYALTVHAIAQRILELAEIALGTPDAAQAAELDSIRQQLSNAESMRRNGQYNAAVSEFVIAADRCANL